MFSGFLFFFSFFLILTVIPDHEMAQALSYLDYLLTFYRLMPSYEFDLQGLTTVLVWLVSFRGLGDGVHVPNCDKL